MTPYLRITEESLHKQKVLARKHQIIFQKLDNEIPNEPVPAIPKHIKRKFKWFNVINFIRQLLP